jgi:hypothetical protein
MTITPEGDIYISNEGGTGVATIFKFIGRKNKRHFIYGSIFFLIKAC